MKNRPVERLSDVNDFKIVRTAHDELIGCGQSLPLGLQDTSHYFCANSDAIIECLGHPQQCQHTVSALHDRLPPELLRQIFLFLAPGHCIVETAIPPLLSSPSWVLGQVSSAWRLLSRSMAELWGTATLHLTDKCTSPGMVQRAFITLPDVCKMDVHVVNALGVAKAALVPYLTRVERLHWQLDDPQLVDLWRMLPPNALSRVVTLDLTCSFRFREVPYNRELIQNKTDQFFGKAARLRFLKLDMPKGILPMVLSMDFPWDNLTSLCISCRSEEDIDILTKVLRSCSALNRLDLQFYINSPSEAYDPLTLHRIKSLTLLGFIPSFLFLSPCIWNELNELCLEQISLPITTLCCILPQCCSIKHLSCCISSSSNGSPASEISITLPHLRTLSITLRQTHIFSLLQTPALEKMIITALDYSELPPISSFITRSGCVVKSFTMSSVKWQTHPYGLRELLFSLDHVTSFSMRGATVHDDLLDGIASATLLPNVKNLLISTPTFDAYMSMVERRLQWEQGLGKMRIGVIGGSAPQEPEGADERAMRRLNEVSERYGVCCQFHEDVADVQPEEF